MKPLLILLTLLFGIISVAQAADSNMTSNTFENNMCDMEINGKCYKIPKGCKSFSIDAKMVAACDGKPIPEIEHRK